MRRLRRMAHSICRSAATADMLSHQEMAGEKCLKTVGVLHLALHTSLGMSLLQHTLRLRSCSILMRS